MRRNVLLALIIATSMVGLSACAPSNAPPLASATSSAPSISVETATYATVEGMQLKADICLPPEPGGTLSPAMLLLHGGGFVEGSRAGMRSLCLQFAEQGVVGISIDYRLLPKHPYPAQVDDATAAIEWARSPETVAKYGLDSLRLGMLGSSAGAIVTATVAARAESGLSAAVALSTVADMTPSGYELGDASQEAEDSVLAYLGCTDLLDCPQSVDGSPLFAVSTQSTPLFLAVGANELVPRGQVEALYEALLADGVPTDLVVVDGDKHGQALLHTEARQRMDAFLEREL